MTENEKNLWRLRITRLEAALIGYRFRAQREGFPFCRAFVDSLSETLVRWGDRLELEKISEGNDSGPVPVRLVGLRELSAGCPRLISPLDEPAGVTKGKA